MNKRDSDLFSFEVKSWMIDSINCDVRAAEEEFPEELNYDAIIIQNTYMKTQEKNYKTL